MEKILFFIFAIGALLGALGVISQKKPLNSLLSLIFTMIFLALIYILLGAPFIAAAQIIVYAGAIMVLFLFMIFILRLDEKGERKRGTIRVLTGAILGAGLFGVVALAFFYYQFAGEKGNLSPETISFLGGNLKVLASLLFSRFFLTFEVASILLLVAMIGAVYIARKG